MFLLLVPSLLTGKRPGPYCPGGQGSQDAPKGPKGELRGWMVSHDKELHNPQPSSHYLLETLNLVLPPLPHLTILHLKAQ